MTSIHHSKKLLCYEDLIRSLKYLLNKACPDLKLLALTDASHDVVVYIVAVLATMRDIHRQELLSVLDESIPCAEM